MSRGAEPDVFLRKLIYIPIIHTLADMGALGESIRQATLRKLGEKGLKHKVNVINKMWTEIERAIEDLSLSYEKVRLYQDGLPVCGREVEIVTDLAKAGSRNHQLLLRLKERGATVVGTESSEFLIEEYQLIKQLLIEVEPFEMACFEARQKALSKSLLKKRDLYIAERINTTLCTGETGILFLGMLHSLENLLDKDIQVIYPKHLSFHHESEEDEKN